jgi:general secretion pathway protein D
VSALAALASCASVDVRTDFDRAASSGDFEAAVEQVRRNRPSMGLLARSEKAWQTQIQQVLDDAIFRLTNLARAALAERELHEARHQLQRAERLEPTNPRVSALRDEIQRVADAHEWIKKSQAALKAGAPELALRQAKIALTLLPDDREALEIVRHVDQMLLNEKLHSHSLNALYSKPLSLEFRDIPIKQLFEIISKTTGINFQLDRDIRPEQKTGVIMRDVSLDDLVSSVLANNQLEKKFTGQNVVLIYPSTQSKLREHQDLLLQVFYLRNHEAKTVAANIKAILKTRDVHPDEKINAIYVRDTPEALAVVDQFIRMQDIQEPEVMLEVDVLEINAAKLLELGIQFPSQLSLTTLNAAGKSGAMLLNEIRGINRGRIETNIGSVGVSARKTDSASNVLANPRIRAKSKEKAKILIGDKVPVITTTSSQGVVTENIQYVEVGVKLEVEPVVSVHDEVTMKLSLEVSSIAREIRSPSGALAYQIGTRSASTGLRLKDGETQILGGLLTEDERNSSAKIPGLGDVPLLGRLFGLNRDEGQKSELVLAITPRLVRTAQRPGPAGERVWAGTEAITRGRSLDALNTAAKSQIVTSGVAKPLSNADLRTDRPSIGVGNLEPSKASITWGCKQKANVPNLLDCELGIDADGGVASAPLQFAFDPKQIEVLAVEPGPAVQAGGGSNFSKILDNASGFIGVSYSRPPLVNAVTKGVFVTFSLRIPNAQTPPEIRLVTSSVMSDSGTALPLTKPEKMLVMVR